MVVTVLSAQIDDAAVRIIQSNIRKAKTINDWSWWKLLNKIKPLMVVRKTEAEKKEIAVSHFALLCSACVRVVCLNPCKCIVMHSYSVV